MAIKWEFQPGKVTYEHQKTEPLPHLKIAVLADGKQIGYAEVHLHKHLGKDKKRDVSFGFTAVIEKLP